MSSAIEVLKSEMSVLIRLNEIDGLDAKSKEMNQRTIDALGEAIVALEKQESDKILFLTLNKENVEFRKERAKLKEWLEKEIKTMEDLEKINYTGAFGNDLRILKQVLVKVGEQK